MPTLSPKDVFTNPEIKATTALAFLIDAYGTECLSWDPATLLMQVEEDYAIKASSRNMDRVNAGCALLLNNLFHVSIEAFSTICSTLGQGGAITSTFVPAGLEDVVWGITEAALLQGDDFREQTFVPDIRLYVGYLLDQDGIYEPPAALAFAEYPSPDASRNTDAFLDDDIAYQQYWQSQQGMKEALESVRTQGLVELFQQLEALPLEDKNTEFITSILTSIRGS